MLSFHRKVPYESMQCRIPSGPRDDREIAPPSRLDLGLRPTHSARATDDLLAQDIDLACLANRELGAAKGPAPLQGELHGNTVNKTRCTAAAFGLSRKQKRRALDREFGHGTTDFGKRMLRSRGRSVAHRRRRRGRRTVGHRNRHSMPGPSWALGRGLRTQRERGETDRRRTSILNGCCFAIWGQRGSHGVRYEGLSLLQASGQG